MSESRGSVKVLPGDNEQMTIEMFTRQGYSVVDTIAQADIICFTGGADVNPELYDEQALPLTSFNEERDYVDTQYYHESGYKFKIGICRGGQFLNVMNGGKMWQHVDNHTKPHYLTDLKTREQILVSSTHHQMMIPNDRGIVIAVAQEATSKAKHRMKLRNTSNDPDVEVVMYEDTNSLCFQPHPEFSVEDDVYQECCNYFFNLIKEIKPCVD